VNGYLLDTNHAGRLIDPRHPVRARVGAAQRDGQTIYIIVPVITETVYGFSVLPRTARNQLEWQIVRPALVLIDLDERDALDAARLQVALRRRGHRLHTVDALIAATALRYDLTLLTTDHDFAAVPGLRAENWVP